MSSPFEIRGEFAGFVRNVLGKRRLLLRTTGGDIALKVSRDLRQQATHRIALGANLAVSGIDYLTSGKPHRAVLRLQLLDSTNADACFTCPIRVCAKKNCWKQGGRELWHALENESTELGGALTLERVDCLDRCKRAPNLDCGTLELERCSPDHARELARELAGLATIERL